MSTSNARSLGREAQVALRKRAIEAVLGGMKQREVARCLGVSPEVVCRWLKRYREDGAASLQARRKGPAPGTGALLTEKQSAEIRRLIIDKCPEQLKLPYGLWTRDAVGELIERRLGIRLSVRTVGNYLRDWGFTPRKPVRRAYEQSPKAVQAWIDEAYPTLAKRAKRENAIIFWADEMGMRSDHHFGRSYGRRGKTPVVPATAKRFSCSMISALTNQGHLCFRVFEGSFNVRLFLDFLRRLIRQAGRRVFLIVDCHPVHRAKLVQAWRKEHADEIEIFYLPSYSPQLNPDEMLNQDVKTNVSRHARPANVEEMKADLRSYLFSTQKQPHIVRRYFLQEHMRYAIPDAA